MSSSSSLEVIENEELFDKHRGQRRWLGKEHHRGKDKLYDSVKDRVFIQKTIESPSPIGKNATQKILNQTKDDFDLNVCYSIDKKNRWMNMNNVNLLKCASTNINSEVVERNILKNILSDEKHKAFAVHSKIRINEDDPEDFEIRTASSSGPAQNYSNFLPKSRELSEKSSKKQKEIVEESNVIGNQPTLVYNIYKAHSSKEIVGGQLLVTKGQSKTGKSRKAKHANDYDEFEYDSEGYNVSEDEEVDVGVNKYANSVDLSQLVVDKSQKNQQNRLKKGIDHDEKDSIDDEHTFENIFNVHEFLEETHYTFYKAESVKFSKIKDIDLKETAQYLTDNTKATVTFLKENQILIDATQFSSTDQFSYGETTLVIVVTQVGPRKLNFLINSTLPIDPSKKNENYLSSFISASHSLYEAIYMICQDYGASQILIDNMKNIATLFNTKYSEEMLRSSDYWNQHKAESKFKADNERSKSACCTEMLSIGVKQDYDHICAMVRETSTSYTVESTEGKMEKKKDVRCSECLTQLEVFELFEIVGGARKCGGCLKNEFYREFRANRLPIDLKITDSMGSNKNMFDFLPAIIPLPMFNLYTMKMFKSIYKDLGANGIFESCPNCKATHYFEETPSSLDRSCSCGYCWCSLCESAPHWPMTCKEFSSWQEKWKLRYFLCKSEGNGNETLMRLTCENECSLFSVKLPMENIRCSKCERLIDENLVETAINKSGKKWIYEKFENWRATHYNYRPYNYRFFGFIKIDGIHDLKIRKSVVKICEKARTLRFDKSNYSDIKTIERELVKNKKIQPEILGNMMGSIHYLVETVSGWMFISNQYDANIRTALNELSIKWEELWNKLHSDDRSSIASSIENLQKDIKSIISVVQEKLDNQE